MQCMQTALRLTHLYSCTGPQLKVTHSHESNESCEFLKIRCPNSCRPQYPVIIIIRTPKKGAPNFWTPPAMSPLREPCCWTMAFARLCSPKPTAWEAWKALIKAGLRRSCQKPSSCGFPFRRCSSHAERALGICLPRPNSGQLQGGQGRRGVKGHQPHEGPRQLRHAYVYICMCIYIYTHAGQAT